MAKKKRTKFKKSTKRILTPYERFLKEGRRQKLADWMLQESNFHSASALLRAGIGKNRIISPEEVARVLARGKTDKEFARDFAAAQRMNPTITLEEFQAEDLGREIDRQVELLANKLRKQGYSSSDIGIIIGQQIFGSP